MMSLQPRLLLLDEPSSGIAQRATESLGVLLHNLATDLALTLVIIEHDMPLIMSLAYRITVQQDGRFPIDMDLVALGRANDDPVPFDELGVLLDEKGPNGEQARRLWRRYVRRSPEDTAAERSWLAQHRGRMFFSD